AQSPRCPRLCPTPAQSLPPEGRALFRLPDPVSSCLTAFVQAAPDPRESSGRCCASARLPPAAHPPWESGPSFEYDPRSLCAPSCSRRRLRLTPNLCLETPQFLKFRRELEGS